MPDSVRARCRLIPDFNVVAGVGAAMSALFFGFAITQSPNDFESWSVCLTMLALFAAAPLYWLLARVRGVISFDENGARWRTALGAWHSARWDEIASADARMTSTGGRIACKFVVRTRNGEFSWTNAFENAAALAPFAARFCPLVPDDAADWPRRFSYRSGENLFVGFAVLFLSCGMLAILLAFTGARRGSEVVPQIEIFVGLYGWPLTLAGFALFGAIVLGVPALFLLFFLRMTLDGWRHRDEIFVATTRGLSWSKGGRELRFAAWDELQTLHIEARGPLIALPFYRLQSARGDFRWDNMLCGGTQLSQTLFERAPQLESVTQASLREELDEAQTEPSETMEFGFKTRSRRGLLWGGVTFSLFMWGITIFGPLEPPEGGAPLPTWISFILAVMVTAATIYGVQLFRRGAVRLDARGIEWDLPLRKRFVAWQQIDGLIVDRKLWLQIGERRVPLAIWDIHPTHLERLLEIVAQRAVNAGGEWKSASKVAQTEAAE